jgi:hypothetical protein
MTIALVYKTIYFILIVNRLWRNFADIYENSLIFIENYLAVRLFFITGNFSILGFGYIFTQYFHC